MTRDRFRDVSWAALIAVVVLGPMLTERGFALRGDMVFVPQQPWKDAWLGLDGAVPRFVPGDALLSAATNIIPGDLVQKLLLFAGLTLGGLGAGRLVGSHAFASRAAVVLFFLWNPWVYERLAIGQWGFVMGYAVLPWAAMAARAMRNDPRQGAPGVVVALGTGAIFSPPAALMVTATVLCVLLVRPRWSVLALAAGAALIVNLPWLLPSLLRTGYLTPAAGQFEAFAARGESALGLLPSLLSLGGIWKSSVVPEERTVWLLVLLSCITTFAAVVGLRCARRDDPAFVAGLTVLAIGSLTLAGLPAIPRVAAALDHVATAFPFLGILRDSQRYLAPAILVLLPGLATAMTWLRDQVAPGREAVLALAALLGLLPALALPSMFWGLRGALQPVRYPEEWTQVARNMSAVTTVVLPWRGTYRGFAWNGYRATLDPAPRFFPGTVLIDDRHYIDDIELGHEDPRLASITSALAASDPARELREVGVSQVLVEKDNGISVGEAPDGKTLHDGPGLMLLDLGPAKRSWPSRSPHETWILVGDTLALITYSAAIAVLVRRSVYGAGNFGERKQEER